MTSTNLTRSTGRWAIVPRRAMAPSQAPNRAFRDTSMSPPGAETIDLTVGLSLNVYEQDDRYIMLVLLPGVKPDQLTITARENVVTLQGTIDFPAPEGARAIYQGVTGGQFREQMVLPGDIDAENASAQYQDGVLTLTLPKAPHARERKITVGPRRAWTGAAGQDRASQSVGPGGAVGQDQASQSGRPGGGAGRRDEPGHTGVYPVSAMDEASPDAPIKGEMEWGQGERGMAGYEDHGESELVTIPPED
jgi:HSP20 family protein